MRVKGKHEVRVEIVLSDDATPRAGADGTDTGGAHAINEAGTKGSGGAPCGQAHGGGQSPQ